MKEFIDFFLQILPILLILLAWFTGRAAEKNHIKRLNRRENQLSEMLVTNIKSFPPSAEPQKHAELVVGQVVIATDYLKSFLANIKKIFGGNLKSYESLMNRARREAVIRMLEEAHENGYDAVCNMRLQFSDIGGMSASSRGNVMVEVFAFGTAYCRAKS